MMSNKFHNLTKDGMSIVVEAYGSSDVGPYARRLKASHKNRVEDVSNRCLDYCMAPLLQFWRRREREECAIDLFEKITKIRFVQWWLDRIRPFGLFGSQEHLQQKLRKFIHPLYPVASHIGGHAPAQSQGGTGFSTLAQLKRCYGM